VLLDQRGAGRSRPHASLAHNTTWDLVDDLERLREEIGIQRWLVFGGSWGSTLGLAYAQKHPERVRALVLRGIFLATSAEIGWFNQRGTSEFFPEAWRVYLEAIPPEERHDLLGAYHRRLAGPDPALALRAAKAWSYWEAATSYLQPRPEHVRLWTEDEALALAVARIECHYMVHGAFLRSERQLLEDAGRLANIPGVIVHGRYDCICPVKAAFALHEVWPTAELRIVPDAGHAAFEPGTVHELVEATDRLCER
jgi:proline iminopeptidase